MILIMHTNCLEPPLEILIQIRDRKIKEKEMYNEQVTLLLSGLFTIIIMYMYVYDVSLFRKQWRTNEKRRLRTKLFRDRLNS